MARKFIITDNKFLYGNVELHMELVPRKPRARVGLSTFGPPQSSQADDTIKVLGGGRWHPDAENKILYLWGASTDFGYAEPELIKKAIASPETWMSLSMEGWQIKHSPIIANNLPEVSTFTDLMLVP